jgi:hypothetical protein
MSKAISGDGVLRAKILEAGKALVESAADLDAKMRVYYELVFESEVTTRNNMNTASAGDQAGVLRGLEEVGARIMSAAHKCFLVMESAHAHHKAQTSVAKSSIFGQIRRIKSDGTVSVAAPLDPMKFAERALKDGFSEMSPDQQASYIVRGQNPHLEFFSWDAGRQRAYLVGQLDENGGAK